MQEKQQRLPLVVLIFSMAAFLIPLAASKSVSWHFSLPKLLLIGCLSGILACIYMFILTRRTFHLRWHPVIIPLSVFFICVLFSVFTSVNVYTSILGKYGRYEGLITLTAYSVIFWLAFQHNWRRKEVWLLLVSAVAGSVLVSIYAVSQFVGFDPVIWSNIKFESNRAFSTFGNPSLLSGYLVLTLFPALGLFLNGAAGISSRMSEFAYKLIFAAAAMIIGLALFATLTRGGWIAALVGFLFMTAVLFVAGLKRPAVYLAGALVFLIITSLLLSFFAYSGAGSVTIDQRLATITSKSGTVYQRLEIWRTALRAAAARPLLGWGPDNFRVAFSRYETAEYVRRAGPGQLQDNAHNYILQLAATMGWPAALFFILSFIWILYLLVKQSLTNKDLLTIGLAAALAGYFINILFVVNVVGAAFLFWLFLGVSLGVSVRKVKKVKLNNGVRAALLLALVLLAAIQISVPAFEFAADYHREIAAQQQADHSLAAALPDYQAAFRLNPWLGRYRFQLGTSYFYQALRSHRASDYAAARRYLAQAVDIDPYNVDNLLFQAQTEIFAWQNHTGGDLNAAYLKLEEVLRRQPLSLSARYLIALIDYDQGQYQAAKRQLKQALAIYPAFADATDLLKAINAK